MGEEINCTRFCSESPKERVHSEDGRRGQGGITTDLREIGWGVWIGLDRLRIGTGG
jgi:hypothetical protein